jgi:glutamate carboxypeptidase
MQIITKTSRPIFSAILAALFVTLYGQSLIAAPQATTTSAPDTQNIQSENSNAKHLATTASTTTTTVNTPIQPQDQTPARALNAAAVKQLISSQFNDFVNDLKTLTNIDSGTGNLEGNKQIVEFLKQRITQLGGTTELRTGPKGTHVIGRFRGEGKMRILLTMHTDTVFEKGEAAKRPFYVDKNNLAHGPGAGDDKAAVVEALHMIKAFNEIGVKNYGEIIAHFDCEEEAKSDFEDTVLKDLAKQADVAIVLDTSPHNWGITTQRKGRFAYKMHVAGIGGHPGSSPQTAANAIMELGHQISMLTKLASPLPKNQHDYTAEALKQKGIVDRGQFIPKNTINVGIISSTNTKINTVPDNAVAEFEVRSYEMAELFRLDKAIKEQANHTVIPGTKVTVEGRIIKPPMEKSPIIEKYLDIYKKIVKREYNIDIIENKSGGGTVGNIIAQTVPILDSFGIEADEEHTVKEYADLNTFVPRTATLMLFIDEVSKNFNNNAQPLK